VFLVHFHLTRLHYFAPSLRVIGTVSETHIHYFLKTCLCHYYIVSLGTMIHLMIHLFFANASSHHDHQCKEEADGEGCERCHEGAGQTDQETGGHRHSQGHATDQESTAVF
jgi:hypothetical protein